jgi:hypothetical protein
MALTQFNARFPVKYCDAPQMVHRTTSCGGTPHFERFDHDGLSFP